MVTKSKTGQVVLNIVFIILAVWAVAPFLLLISSSLSSEAALAKYGYGFWPREFSLNAYTYLFKSSMKIAKGYGITLIVTLVGTTLSVLITTLFAYPLSRKEFRARGGIAMFFVFTMYFSGGLVPSYILVNSLHLTNTRWAMIIPSAMSTYNMIICRTYMSNSIPDEMYEAAQIDGCTPWKYFLRIVTPLCKPILAVLTLYYGVAKWNDYYTAMIYLRDDTLMPLTIVMKEILIQNKVDMTQIGDASNLAKLQGMSELLKYSTIVVASIPVMLLYPLVQKHLVKGVMIGAVKG